ncbi:MAG: hypothetical protein KF802_02350 [Bdellovibrionaceae bacterium]|nr:hypothetical protein [Pseudobdellovibrionaceae bacterium]
MVSNPNCPVKLLEYIVSEYLNGRPRDSAIDALVYNPNTPKYLLDRIALAKSLMNCQYSLATLFFHGNYTDRLNIWLYGTEETRRRISENCGDPSNLIFRISEMPKPNILLKDFTDNDLLQIVSHIRNQILEHQAYLNEDRKHTGHISVIRNAQKNIVIVIGLIKDPAMRELAKILE